MFNEDLLKAGLQVGMEEIRECLKKKFKVGMMGYLSKAVEKKQAFTGAELRVLRKKED